MTPSTGPRISRLTLGTMRLDGVGGEEQAVRLLSHAFEIGVRSFHCSAEYGSFSLFASAWRRARLAERGGALIAKLASPHFGEDRFSAAQVRAKLDVYRAELDVEHVEVVQWLLRHDLKQEEARLRILRDADAELADLVAALKHEGRIGSFVGFPYTRPVAEELTASGWCDGLAVYVNPLEREMDGIVDACAAKGKSVVALRPFAAGRLFSETSMTADEAYSYALAFPAVVTSVASASSIAHLDAMKRHLAAVA